MDIADFDFFRDAARDELHVSMDRSFKVSIDHWPEELRHPCGSTACIAGWLADKCSHQDIDRLLSKPRLADLFYSPGLRGNNKQAARAIVNFLTLGDPRWDDVMREPA